MLRTVTLMAALLAVLTMGMAANADDVTTIQDGDWDQPSLIKTSGDGFTSVWDSGSLPVAGDVAIINHEIFVDRPDNGGLGYVGYDATPADVVVNAGGAVKAWMGVFTCGDLTLNGGQIAANQRTHVLTADSITINDVAGNEWAQYKNQNSKHARIVTPLLLGDGQLDVSLGHENQRWELNVTDTTGFTGILNVSRLGHDLPIGDFANRLYNGPSVESNVAWLKINQSISQADATFEMVLTEYTFDWKETDGGSAALDDGTAYNGYDMRDGNSEVWLTGLTIGGYVVPGRATAYTAAELAAMDGGNVANYLRTDGTDGLLGVKASLPTGACDFDTDGDCDLDDLDLLTLVGDLGTGVAVPPADAKFDLDTNSTVNQADLGLWLSGGTTENGHGTAYRAGDNDLDRDVDITDFNNLATNFDAGGSNSATNKFSVGDGDGDGDVDITDFNALASAFAPGGYDGAAAAVAADADPGQVDLVVDVATGEVTLDGNNAAISGLQVFSAGNSLLATDFTADVLQFVISTNTSTYAEGAFANMGVDGLISLGMIYDALVDARDVTFEYTMIGQPTVQGNVIYVPEPASLVLMGMGGLLVLRRRRAA